MNKFESHKNSEISPDEISGNQINNNEKEKQPEILYHFTIDPRSIKDRGFRGSENIDAGIGGRGQSLYGTYFFNDLEDAESYRPLFDHLQEKTGKKGTIIQAELSPEANILDSSKDENALYLKEYYEFKKTTELEAGTAEFQKNFTEYLRNKGYDAVKVSVSLLGNHTEVIVINEDKLKFKDVLS